MGSIDEFIDDIKHAIYISEKRKSALVDGVAIITTEFSQSVVIDKVVYEKISDQVKEISNRIDALEKLICAIEEDGEFDDLNSSRILYRITQFESVVASARAGAKAFEDMYNKNVELSERRITFLVAELGRYWRFVNGIKQEHEKISTEHPEHACCIGQSIDALGELSKKRFMGPMELENFLSGEADE